MAQYVLKVIVCVVGISFLPIFAQEQAEQNVQAQEQTTAPTQSDLSLKAAAEEKAVVAVELSPEVKSTIAEQTTVAEDQPIKTLTVTTPVVEKKTAEDLKGQEERKGVSATEDNTIAPEAIEGSVEVQKEQATTEEVQPATVIEQEATKELENVSVPEQKQAEIAQQQSPKNTVEAANTKEDEIQEIKQEEPAEPEGIDTLDIQGGGNWLLKRGWWEQAERKYEKAKVLLDKILDARTPFLDKRAELDRTVFDPFYAQMGLDQGRLEETLSFLNDEVNQERDKEGTLTEEQRLFLDTLTMQKKTLEQLALDVSAINKLDHQVDAVIAKLMEQINRARGYEKQAWQSFKEIARELSDERARELAGAMDSYFANMEAIYTYIVTDLAQFYAKLVEDGTKQVEQVKAEMQALKEKGIDIKGQSERLRQQEMSPESTQSEEEIKKALEKAKAEQQGFFRKMFSYVTGFFSSIGRFFSTIFSSIFGRK